MANHPSREEQIFNAVLQLRTREERAAYLKGACVDDAALLQRVEALLQKHEQVGTIRDPDVTIKSSPSTDLPAVVPITEKPGDRIGRYKLLQEIGEGGCGAVYMAEQEEPVRRRVALKIIKLGMDTKQVIARFEAERQALALMDHPNIAKVFDAGTTETGRPFFVMELVRGVPITEYCDKNNLTTRQRLDLFIPICRAIQHAHQKGIIHRDIKPSNILVTLHDGEPVPKVIDFGIAKAIDQPLTEKTLFTRLDQFIGTPAYMSPEQAEMSGLDIDTRSDIYSLGVVLYELLTGRPPFDPEALVKSGLDAMRRTIREVEPPRPSTRLSTMTDADLTTIAKKRGTEPARLSALVRGDLDWIAMKSMEKDRTRRYDTANGLAADIQRHLSNEPVVACPPGNLYKFQKLVRRNKLTFIAASAVTAALIIGLGVSTWMFFKEQQARRQAEAERKRAETEAAKSQQVAQFLKDMLKGVRPSVALGRDTTMLQEILDKTTERVGKDLQDQPIAESELLATIGRVYYALGQYAKAEAMEREALALNRKLFGNESPLVAELLDDLVDTLHEEDKNVEGEAIAREALAIQRKPPGTKSPAVARSLQILGVVLNKQGKMAEAETAYREALAMYKDLLGSENPDAVWSLMGVGNVVWDQGKLAEAEADYREVLAIQKKAYGAQHPDMEVPLDNLAKVLIEQGKLAEAEVVAREVLALQRKMLGEDHPHLVRSIWIITNVLRDQGKVADGETLGRELVSLQRKRLGNEDLEVGAALTRLGEFVATQGRLTEAETIFRQAMDIERKQPVDENPGLRQWSLEALGNVLNQQGKLSEAGTSYREELEITRNMWPNNPDKWEGPANALAGVLTRQGEYHDAEQVFSDLLTSTIESQTNGAGLLRARGDLRARNGRWQEAAADFSKLVQLVPADEGAYYRLAPLLVQSGQLDDYRAHCRKMMEQFADSHTLTNADRIAIDCLILPSSGVDPETVSKMADTALKTGTNTSATPCLQFAESLIAYRQGHFAIAAEWAVKALASPGVNEREVELLMVLAMSKQQLGQVNEARAALAKGVEIAETKLPKLENGNLGDSWVDWSIAHELIDEARMRIEGGASAQK
jgi:eukaryotic-like serine/threonine-protein kinase